jgi:N-terminal acetyltransferase B complex catalytic subunit
MDVLEALSGPREVAVPSADAPGASATSASQSRPEDERGNKDAVDAWFVDLFVRCNNVRAVEMYERMGYSVYRRVVE